jgi:hypothetical protein
MEFSIGDLKLKFKPIGALERGPGVVDFVWQPGIGRSKNYLPYS